MRVRIRVKVYDNDPELTGDPREQVLITETRELHISAPRYMMPQTALELAGIEYLDCQELHE